MVERRLNLPMKCPSCQSVLQSHDLEENLKTLLCGECGGHWVKSYQYWKWLERHGPNLPERAPENDTGFVVEDGERARLCPECGHVLTRAKVGHGLDFHLERCMHCGGIWFDKNEWEALKSRNLHDDVHFVFSTAWQRRVLEEENAQAREERLVDALGKDGYAELNRIKAWIDAQEHRDAVFAYLMGLSQ